MDMVISEKLGHIHGHSGDTTTTYIICYVFKNCIHEQQKLMKTDPISMLKISQRLGMCCVRSPRIVTSQSANFITIIMCCVVDGLI